VGCLQQLGLEFRSKSAHGGARNGAGRKRLPAPARHTRTARGAKPRARHPARVTPCTSRCAHSRTPCAASTSPASCSAPCTKAPRRTFALRTTPCKPITCTCLSKQKTSARSAPACGAQSGSSTLSRRPPSDPLRSPALRLLTVPYRYASSSRLGLLAPLTRQRRARSEV
jgi:hypothetical protein